MRIAIYGTGGLGGYYGARLHEAGHEVTFIARGANLAAMRDQGLKVLSPLGDVTIASPKATDNPQEAGSQDVVVVAVKTWQVEDIARAMTPMLHPQTVVVPFLNGVEAPDQLNHVLGANHAVGGLSKVFSLLESPGVVRHFNEAAIVAFNELNGPQSKRIHSLKDVFESAGVDVEIPADITAALWEKLAMVTSWAGLGALSQTPIGGLRSVPETRELISASMRETIAVAKAKNIGIRDDLEPFLWSFYDALPEGATASMMRDIFEKKPSELDAWNGAVHRFGLQTGTPTPVHSMVYHLLSPMERRAREPR